MSNLDQMPEQTEGNPEPSATKKRKSGLSKLVEKGKTAVVLGVAAAGIGASEGNLEAHGAEYVPSPTYSYTSGNRGEKHEVNDATRREHYFSFLSLFNKAKRDFKRVDKQQSQEALQKAAQQTAASLDSATGLLKGTDWLSGENQKDLDRQYTTYLEEMGGMYKELSGRFGISLTENGRGATFDSVEKTLNSHMAQRKVLEEKTKAEKKASKGYQGRWNQENNREGSGFTFSTPGSGMTPAPILRETRPQGPLMPNRPQGNK